MSGTPLKDARDAGIKCVGQTNPDTGKYESVIPTQAMVDQEERERETPEEIKQVDINQARESGATTLLELVAPYRKEERDTWPTQEREAREWLVDDKSPCTMVRRIAYHRQIEMAVMVGKIMENVTLFEYVAGDILGVQQKAIEDMESSY